MCLVAPGLCCALAFLCNRQWTLIKAAWHCACWQNALHVSVQLSTAFTYALVSYPLCACHVPALSLLAQAHTFFMQMLQKLEVLESRVSYINSTSISSLDGCSDSSCATSKTVEVAVEAAVHLMERLLVTLQCLAADAATISNTATAAKVEVLVKQLVEGLEAEAAKAQPASIAAVGAPRRQGAPSGNTLLPAVKASALTVLRNAAGVSSKQRVQELEQQVSVLQLRLSDSRAQLSEALSSGARLQRSLQLKTRAVASFEQQLAAARAQLQQLQASQAGQDQTVVQVLT